MTDHQQTIVVSLTDSVPDVLTVLRKAANTAVTLDIPSTSPLFLTANEFRALQAIAQHEQVDLTVTSDDPLRQQLATLFKLKVTPPDQARTETAPEEILPVFGPEVPPDPEAEAAALAEPESSDTDVAPGPERSNTDESALSPSSLQRLDPLLTRARATSTRQRLLTSFAVLFVFLLAFLGAYQFLTKATITLTLKRQPIDQTLSVTILEPGAPTPESGIAIVANPVTFPVSTTRSAPATGVKTIGDVAARGTVTLSNPTGQVVTIAAGARFDDRITGTSYQFVSAVTIAAGADGATGFGQAEVVCLEAGTVGNREVGFLSGLLDNGVYYANRDAAISGGTDKQLTVVTESDLESLQTAALNDLIALASTQSPGPGLVVLIPSIELQQPVITPNAAVDQEATTITVQATGTASALAYNATDLTNAARDALSSAVPDGFELDPAATNLSSPIPSGGSTGNSIMTIRANGSVVASLPDERRGQIADAVAGKNADEVRSYLASQQEVASFTIGYSPGWLPKRIPSDAARVKIETR